jgi:hypothetical protein
MHTFSPERWKAGMCCHAWEKAKPLAEIFHNSGNKAIKATMLAYNYCHRPSIKTPRKKFVLHELMTILLRLPFTRYTKYT